jgi:hypothetical protein
MLAMDTDPKNQDSLQSQGGKARAAKLSKEQRKEIAQRASLARWSNRKIKATHKGSFEKDFGIDVECYVLDDQQKTAVVSQRGLGRAIGLTDKSGAALTRFLETKAMQIRGAEIRQKIASPLVFQWNSPGGETPPGDIYGFDVTILIDLCRAIIDAEAEGALGARNAHIASQAHVILNASAKAGIKGLAYALAGYSPSAEEVINAFKLYVQEEAKKYEKEFPTELYMEWHRLYDIPVLERGRSWHFKHLTVKHIYYPLAKSNGRILELTRAIKARDGDRKKKLFQFLSEVGARALRMQLGRVLEMAESSKNLSTYEGKVLERFGDPADLQMDLPNLSLMNSDQPSQEPS